MLERKTSHLIDPFLGIRNLPDQQEIFNSRTDWHLLRDQDHTRTWLVRHKIRKMVRHRSHIVGDDDSATRRAEFEDLRVLHLLGNHVLRQFEINLWLSQQKTRHDLLIEIGVGEEADLQA